MIERMKKSIVRIYRTSDEKVVGAGFLVDLEHKIVVTCAHVVNSAISILDNTNTPDQIIRLDFPFASKRQIVNAKTIRFMAKTEENEGDIAVLQLTDGPPENADIAPLASTQSHSGNTFGVFGFPMDFERDGQYVEGKLQERLVNNRIQAIGEESTVGYFVDHGFSGSPVYDKTTGFIIGMMSQVDSEAERRVAFLTPIDSIAQVYESLVFRDLRDEQLVDETKINQDYKYDVFISYRHTPKPDSPLSLWVQKLLYEELQERLFFELGREAKIFLDTEEIKTGDTWIERLKNGLAYSRCLIAVWNRPYFSSNWCLSECKVMLHREKQLGYRTTESPEGLVLPVSTYKRIADLRLPEYARAVQYKMFDRYFYPPNKAFRESQKFQEFQEALKSWIEDEVAPAIDNAPVWSPQMISAAWLEHQMIDHTPQLVTVRKAPTLA